MERFGFIHEELDIKILILYVINRLPAAVDFQTLSDLVLIDGGFDYFQYAQCLSELVDSGHIEKNADEEYRITLKGSEHLEASLSRLPYSVRTKADNTMQPIVKKMRRDALITTVSSPLDNGGVMVRLAVSDDVGPMLDMSILTSDEDRAGIMKKHFRENAENVYKTLTEMLTPQYEERGRKNENSNT